MTHEEFVKHYELWHLRSKAEKNSALRRMSENGRKAIKSKERRRALDWEEYRASLEEEGY